MSRQTARAVRQEKTNVRSQEGEGWRVTPDLYDDARMAENPC